MTRRSRLKRSGRRDLRPVIAASGALAILGLGLLTPATASDEPDAVLEPTQIEDSSAPQQSPSRVAAKIDKLANSNKMGKKSSTVVMDPGEQQTLYDDDAERMLIPASSMKVLTAAAALTHIGVNTRIETRTVQPQESKEVYLIGGGDPLLDSKQFKKDPSAPKYPALTSMNKLAKSTAAALKISGHNKVKLKYDASLFTGTDWNPDWPDYFRSRGIVAPVHALMVDDARISNWGPRGDDPAQMAGDRFAVLLRELGIKVSSVSAGQAPGSAGELAVVSSVPVYEIVNQMLSRSDNDTAEALFRLSGLASGSGGSFDGGGKAVAETMQGLGISTVLASFRDGSGLSEENKISAGMLAEIVSQAVRGREDLWPITDGLAVAGVSGSLKYRFGDIRTHAAAGLVRAKTGTLIGISSLTGFANSESGRVLVFASIANEAVSSFEAASVIDRIAARITSCGCPTEPGDSQG